MEWIRHFPPKETVAVTDKGTAFFYWLCTPNQPPPPPRPPPSLTRCCQVSSERPAAGCEETCEELPDDIICSFAYNAISVCEQRGRSCADTSPEFLREAKVKSRQWRRCQFVARRSRSQHINDAPRGCLSKLTFSECLKSAKCGSGVGVLAAAAVCDSENKSLQPVAERAAAKSPSLPTERSRGPMQTMVNKLVN